MKINVVSLFSVFICLIPSDSYGSTSSDLVRGLSNCAKISNDENRLGCFDKLTKNNVLLPTAMKVKDVVAVKIEPVKSKQVKQEDDFSKQHLKKPKEDRGPDSITATISKLKKLIRGQWVVYLENGQKWQQMDSGKLKLKVGNSVRLKKGSMGTVYLYKEGSHRNIRVKRLK